MGIKSQDCDICGQPAKYNCPSCETRSCSVQCVKQHKTLSGCDGQRKKVKYIPINEFTDLDLVQDFRILESATSTIDKCRRDKLKRSTRQGTDVFCAPRISKSLKKLQTEAQRFGTKVKILPPHFVRSKNNSSHFDFKSKSILWDIELHLPLVNKTINLKTIQDSTKLWQIIGRLFEPEAICEKLVDLPLGDFSDDQLDLYRSAGYGGVLVYLKCETLPPDPRDFDSSEVRSKNGRHFYPLELKRSLRRNLEGKVLVEHPVIHIVMKDQECNYREDADCFDLVIDLLSPSTRIEPVEPLGHGEPLDEHGVNADNQSEEPSAKLMKFPGETPRFPQESAGQSRSIPSSLGMVIGEEAGMEADPEAYKQYYDFYLNYYTHKYARECQQAGGGAAAAATFASQHNNASLESRSDSTLPSAFAVLQNMKQPMQPQSLHRSPAAETATTRRSSGDVRLPQAAINKMNAENARKIADEIRNENKNGGLGLLAAYSDSDSDG